MSETKKKRNARSNRTLAMLTAIALVGVSTMALANPEDGRSRLQPRSLTDAERAELIAEASKAGSARQATANEAALMNMSRDEARAQMSRVRPEAKSLGDAATTRIVRKGDRGVAVLGTAFMSEQRVVLSKDGKHLHSCSTAAHAHDEATQAKIDAAARIMAALKGGVRE